ncbi:hypothetical protein BrnaMpl_p5 (mitochondrion) [Brassica napus]|uniref:Orf1 protein n=1 Tax=Brassica napus TaxID=3708 RepID=Q8HD75_BRANA|nr:hypothetical protein BrnaMpl_p5 [Brassica napus]BAC16368.1 orf1 [Brassica napus]
MIPINIKTNKEMSDRKIGFDNTTSERIWGTFMPFLCKIFNVIDIEGSKLFNPDVENDENFILILLSSFNNNLSPIDKSITLLLSCTIFPKASFLPLDETTPPIALVLVKPLLRSGVASATDPYFSLEIDELLKEDD